MRSIFCCLVLGSLLLQNGYGQSAAVKALGTGDAAGTSFELSAGYLIVVVGRIGGLTNLRFVLDTGATRSVVDRKVADRLRVPRQHGQRQVFSFDKTVTLEQAVFQDVQFGPVRLPNPSMLVADLAQFSDFGRDVDAVIGMDLLRTRNLAIDYDSRKLSFGPVVQAGFATVPQADPLFFTVTILIQKHPVHLIVDTGVEGVLLYEDRLLENVPNLKLERRTESTSLGKRLRATWATVPRVSIGSADYDAKVLLVKASPGQSLRGIDGYIGTASLRARAIEFNFTARTLTLRQ
jgi:predicted aspartyl protease